MARIRIVDEWLRSPATPPTRYRSIMVVADGWAEQRVLMRAYAESFDQTRPTIMLHGTELAIGPAGTDPHGPWGIHVQPPVDGRAQELRDQLALAAKRLAGSKASPPRLSDEASSFERKRTNNWAPGTPRDQPGVAPGPYYEPQVAASQHGAPGPYPPPGGNPYGVPAVAPGSMTYVPSAPAPAGPIQIAPPDGVHGGYPPPAVEYVPPQGAAQYVPQQAAPQYVAPQTAQYVPQQPAAQYVPQQPPPQYVAASPVPEVVAAAPANPAQRMTPVPRSPSGRRRGWTSPVPIAGGRTALGYQSGAGAQSAVIRLGLRPAAAARLARLVDRTVPSDFQIGPAERDVLNALGEHDRLTARQVGSIAGVADPVTWMNRLSDKLSSYGLDLVGPGPAEGGEPTYVLRR